MMHATPSSLRPSMTHKLEISVEHLLHWAFAREYAQLDFGGKDVGGYGFVSSTALIVQHEQLGCHVDGGGRSDPHPDADVVASAVAVLPEGCGGRGMALAVVEHARAITRPDPMVGAVPRCVPVSWTKTGGVARGRAEKCGRDTYVIRSRKRQFDVMQVPVTYRPDASQIAYARRVYLSWYGALLEIRNSFQLFGGLSCWSVTDEMPPLEPWLE